MTKASKGMSLKELQDKYGKENVEGFPVCDKCHEMFDPCEPSTPGSGYTLVYPTGERGIYGQHHWSTCSKACTNKLIDDTPILREKRLENVAAYIEILHSLGTYFRCSSAWPYNVSKREHL